MSLFTGLIAFPPTPADDDGRVDVDALAVLVDRAAAAGVDAIGLLGSTGTYAYLDMAERLRAVAAAMEAVDGRVPLIVGVGALRTSWARQLATDAERQGADGLLMAPISYVPLTDAEVALHYRSVAGATALPLCIYNNPGTTHFNFSDELIAELAKEPTIQAIKMPPVANRLYKDEIERLSRRIKPEFTVGYSGDWEATDALLAGSRAWYSVIAGLLPVPALRLTRAAQAGDATEARRIDAAFGRLWRLFQCHGSIRILSEIADHLALPVGAPPLPIRRAGESISDDVVAALNELKALQD